MGNCIDRVGSGPKSARLQPCGDKQEYPVLCGVRFLSSHLLKMLPLQVLAFVHRSWIKPTHTCMHTCPTPLGLQPLSHAATKQSPFVLYQDLYSTILPDVETSRLLNSSQQHTAVLLQQREHRRAFHSNFCLIYSERNLGWKCYIKAMDGVL